MYHDPALTHDALALTEQIIARPLTYYEEDRIKNNINFWRQHRLNFSPIVIATFSVRTIYELQREPEVPPNRLPRFGA